MAWRAKITTKTYYRICKKTIAANWDTASSTYLAVLITRRAFFSAHHNKTIRKKQIWSAIINTGRTRRVCEKWQRTNLDTFARSCIRKAICRASFSTSMRSWILKSARITTGSCTGLNVIIWKRAIGANWHTITYWIFSKITQRTLLNTESGLCIRKIR